MTTPASPRPSDSWRLRHLTFPTLATLALVAARIVLYAGQYAGPANVRPAFEVAGAAQIWLWGLGVALGLIWLYRAWSRVPANARQTYDGRKVSPGDALAGLFVPLYNLYWMFIANIGLCGAIERHARRRGRPTRAPSSLAMAACIVQLIPAIGLLVGPILWSAFMVRVDMLQHSLDD